MAKTNQKKSIQTQQLSDYGWIFAVVAIGIFVSGFAVGYFINAVKKVAPIIEVHECECPLLAPNDVKPRDVREVNFNVNTRDLAEGINEHIQTAARAMGEFVDTMRNTNIKVQIGNDVGPTGATVSSPENSGVK